MPLQAQPSAATPFASEAEAARYKAAFVAAARAAGYASRPEFFYRNRLDITKTKALRHIGVDMLAMDRSILVDGPPDYPTAALYSDVVVHGTVVAQAGDTSRAVYYHSAFRVRVTEAWQGHPTADTVEVQLRSGPLGTFHLYESMAPELEVGQEVVLFLSPVDFAGFAEAEKQGLAPYRNNAAPGSFDLVKAIKVKAGRVFGGKIKLARARRYSKRIAAILDKEHFYQKAF